MKSDEDPILAYQRTGSAEDYDALVAEWLPTIRRFLTLHLGHDVAAAEEVQQEVLVSLWGAAAGFQGRAQFSTFLYRLVRNKAIDYLRKEDRRRRRTVPLEEAADPAEDVGETLARQETVARLFALIQRLPPREKELLFLREIEQWSEKDCAATLGTPVGTLKSRLHRIKKKLFQWMTEDGGTHEQP